MDRAKLFGVILGWASAGLAAHFGAPIPLIVVVGFGVTFFSINALS